MDKDIYKTLKKEPIKKEPDVWISRLVIYKKIDPEPLIIQDIPLTRGLNIIWGEENDEDDESTEITGHSAGKTTFCRLLRYVLGEKTFGKKKNVDQIRRAFPSGYVAAELHVKQKKWSVLRPIGSGRNSYIKAESTIEDLITDHKHPAYQDTYPEDIGLEALLDNLETGGIVRTGENIQWGHILAWCTRDQEARFQNIYEWRSPRSESGSPAFQFPKEGPLFVIRTALGLFLPEELKSEEELASKFRKLEELEKRLEKQKQEPEFRVNLYETQLRQRIKQLLPDQDVDDMPVFRKQGDLVTQTIQELLEDKLSSGIKAAIQDSEGHRKTLQDKIDELGAKIRQSHEQLEEYEVAFSLCTSQSSELNGGITQTKIQREKIEKFKNSSCLGGILIKDCERVQARQQTLKIKEIQDVNAAQKNNVDLRRESQKIEAEKQRIQEELVRLEKLRKNCINERDDRVAGIREKQRQLQDLNGSWDEYLQWHQKQEEPDGYQEVSITRQKIDGITKEIESLERQLNQQLDEHSVNKKLLANIFSHSVKSVLASESYNGQVGFDGRQINFQITHGPAMSGEAVETLSVLLADLSCLIYNSLNDKSCLLGFLLHDSPREADLSRSIYASFIRYAATIQEHFAGTDECPFQYIITTTTPPPKELRGGKYVKLQLNASKEEEMLLRVNISNVITTENMTLIDDTGHNS